MNTNAIDTELVNRGLLPTGPAGPTEAKHAIKDRLLDDVRAEQQGRSRRR